MTKEESEKRREARRKEEEKRKKEEKLAQESERAPEALPEYVVAARRWHKRAGEGAKTVILVMDATGEVIDAVVTPDATDLIPGAVFLSITKDGTKVYKVIKRVKDKLPGHGDDLTGPLKKRLGDPPANLKKPQAHHDLPQAERFKKQWERAGLDIDDPAYGRWVEGGPVGKHQKWSREFNSEWDKFFESNPNANKKEILEFMNMLRKDQRFQ